MLLFAPTLLPFPRTLLQRRASSVLSCAWPATFEAMEVVSRAASRTAAAPELRETNDPLMQAYLVARSEPTRAGAIQKARRVVELACAELAERDPELRSTSFGRARALDSQLGKLEKRSRAGLGGVPSAAIAAMRLVQAQGKYWSHANRETVARQETFEQVMEALSLVVRRLAGRADGVWRSFSSWRC